jgi:hypothetical protein
LGKEGKEKRKSGNDIVKHNICEGRGYNKRTCIESCCKRQGRKEGVRENNGRG